MQVVELECREVRKKSTIAIILMHACIGVDTENGRELKNGVVPVFGAGAYNPKEKVTVNGQKITLAQYAARMNIKLLRPADFNVKLRERGVEKKATVQKICRVCKDEKDVRRVVNEIWNEPDNAFNILLQTSKKNERVYSFENKLNC